MKTHNRATVLVHGLAWRMSKSMAEFYVYKDAVTQSADKVMANITGSSRCARGTSTRRLLRTCLRNYLPTLPAPRRRPRGAERGGERGTAAGPEGDARSDRTPYARDAPDGTGDTRESRGRGGRFREVE
jgi:hypothetical protein